MLQLNVVWPNSFMTVTKKGTVANFLLKSKNQLSDVYVAVRNWRHSKKVLSTSKEHGPNRFHPCSFLVLLSFFFALGNYVSIMGEAMSPVSALINCRKLVSHGGSTNLTTASSHYEVHTADLIFPQQTQFAKKRHSACQTSVRSRQQLSCEEPSIFTISVNTVFVLIMGVKKQTELAASRSVEDGQITFITAFSAVWGQVTWLDLMQKTDICLRVEIRLLSPSWFQCAICLVWRD